MSVDDRGQPIDFAKLIKLERSDEIVPIVECNKKNKSLDGLNLGLLFPEEKEVEAIIRQKKSYQQEF